MPKPHTRKTESKKIESSYIENSQPIHLQADTGKRTVPSAAADEPTDDETILSGILDQCELELFSDGVRRKEEAAIVMFTTATQRVILDLLQQFGAIREDQAEKILKQTFPHAELRRTIFPLLSGRRIKQRRDKLWRYDVCPVAYGTEAVISAQLEGKDNKYRMVVFVLEKEEQIQGIQVTCEHCYVLKNAGEYEFYLYSKKGD